MNIYPYSNFHELNLDWIIGELKEFQERLDVIAEEGYQKSKEYVDSQLSGLRQDFDNFKQDVNNTLDLYSEVIGDFKREVNDRLTVFQSELDGYQQQLDNSVAGLRSYTDIKIEQSEDKMQQYIADQVLNNISVLDPFTGEYVTIQYMINYLSTLHMTGGATYDEFAAARKTINSLVALGHTYTEWATNGREYLQGMGTKSRVVNMSVEGKN